jgi:hypothetical protein
VVIRPAYSGANTVDVVLTATIRLNDATAVSNFEASVVSLPGSLALQLEYEDTENIADLLQINGSAQAGVTYMSNPFLFSLNNIPIPRGAFLLSRRFN